MSYNNISACILSSHHTHGKKDLNKQFSHSEKHTPMLERSLRLPHRLTAKRTQNSFSQNCLPYTDTDEGERAGREVGDTVWKATTARSDPPLSQLGAFQASIM